jgi:DnaJ-class molecular chaperone
VWRTQADATERFTAAKQAYEILSDPQQRAAYNRQRASQSRSVRFTRHASGGASSSRVVYEAADLVDDAEEEGEDTAQAGFWGWYPQSGSWQSSWQAGAKRRRWQQQQQQR